MLVQEAAGGCTVDVQKTGDMGVPKLGVPQSGI